LIENVTNWLWIIKNWDRNWWSWKRTFYNFWWFWTSSK